MPEDLLSAIPAALVRVNRGDLDGGIRTLRAGLANSPLLSEPVSLLVTAALERLALAVKEGDANGALAATIQLRNHASPTPAALHDTLALNEIWGRMLEDFASELRARGPKTSG
jgi:hypothetical protein